MKLLIRLVKDGVEETTKQWDIPIKVDETTAQAIVNRDFSLFIEGGGIVEIIGQIVPLD